MPRLNETGLSQTGRIGQLGETWDLDEVYLKIDGRLQYL
jgi:transposase-like protein